MKSVMNDGTSLMGTFRLAFSWTRQITTDRSHNWDSYVTNGLNEFPEMVIKNF